MLLSDLIEKYSIRLNVIGRLELLPESVQLAARKAEIVSGKKSVCSPYSLSLTHITSVNLTGGSLTCTWVIHRTMKSQ
jgi:hypothetical protein